MLPTPQLAALPSVDARQAPDISVIVPTFNEQDNVAALLEKLETALEGEAWEVIFVDDDSTDRTLEILQDLARCDRRVRYIHRVQRRGLSSAVVEGLLSSSAPCLVVMDADLQHDETVLRKMLARIREGECDVVVGSRYVDGGVGDWEGTRQSHSGVATKLAKTFLKVEITDPMSGFFALTRETLTSSVRKLSPRGYRILLDILASTSKPPRIVELPYQFRTRTAGESKLDSLVAFEFFEMLLDKTIGRVVPTRFLIFMAVGGVGVAVHMAILSLTLFGLGQQFVVAQTAAATIAMAFNFFVHNALTYRDKRIKGFWPVVGGLVTFYAVCAFGATANVGIANYMFLQESAWWLAALAGTAVGAVWNFAASKVFTWR